MVSRRESTESRIGGGQFVEAKAFVAEEEFGVGPGAPLRRVDVVADEGGLLRGEEGEEGVGGCDDGGDWHALVLKGEEVGADAPCGGCK